MKTLVVRCIRCWAGLFRKAIKKPIAQWGGKHPSWKSILEASFKDQATFNELPIFFKKVSFISNMRKYKLRFKTLVSYVFACPQRNLTEALVNR